MKKRGWKNRSVAYGKVSAGQRFLFKLKKMDDLLKKVYTDPEFSSAAYAGVGALLKEAKKHDPKIKKEDVVTFLNKSRTYTLHRPVRHHFHRQKTISYGYFDTCQADLADMQKLAKKNDGLAHLKLIYFFGN